MNKYILLISCFLLFTISSQSQVLISLLLGDKLNSDKLEFGLESGVNWSKIGNMESTSSLATFNIGFYFDLKLKRPEWSVYTGVLVKSNLGLNHLKHEDLVFLGIEDQNENEDEDGKYKQKLNMFLVPILMKYKFKSSIYVEGGVQLGWVTKAYVEYKSDFNDIETLVKEYNKDQIHKFDMGLLGGFGYQFKKGRKMSVGVKYYYGLLDVYKDRSGTNNKSIFLKVNVPIGREKAKKESAEEQAKKDKAALEEKNAELQRRIEELEK